jgi:hypothetical protein
MKSHSMPEALPLANTAAMRSEKTFEEGDLIGVPCTIRPGPFPNERLIAVETDNGLFYGFANEGNLRTYDGEQGFLEGVVIDASSESIVVRLFGSFFRTAMGLAYVRRDGVTRIAAAQ